MSEPEIVTVNPHDMLRKADLVLAASIFGEVVLEESDVINVALATKFAAAVIQRIMDAIDLAELTGESAITIHDLKHMLESRMEEIEEGGIRVLPTNFYED